MDDRSGRVEGGLGVIPYASSAHGVSVRPLYYGTTAILESLGVVLAVEACDFLEYGSGRCAMTDPFTTVFWETAVGGWGAGFLFLCGVFNLIYVWYRGRSDRLYRGVALREALEWACVPFVVQLVLALLSPPVFYG